MTGDLLPQRLARRAGEHPDDPVVEVVGGATVTARDLHHDALRWAAALERLGVGAGDHVVTMLPDSVTSFAAWVGLAWLRAVEVPVNVMQTAGSLRYAITHSGAAVAVVASSLLERLEEVAADLPAVETVVVPDADVVPGGWHSRAIAASALFDTLPSFEPEVGPAVHDVMSITYTSGTTGPPKGVRMPWGQLHYIVEHPQPAGVLGPGDGFYCVWPGFHGLGKLALQLVMAAGGRLVLRDGFDAAAFWDDVRRHGCTYTVVSGPMARTLLLQGGGRDHPLRAVTMAPMFPGAAAFAERFGVAVSTWFGGNETGAPLVNLDPVEWRSSGRARPGPPGVEVRVVDEHDAVVPPGQVGELIVRTAEPWALNAGYFNMPEATAAAWRNGWFHTGDAFVRDEAGNHHFVDRLPDLIRRGGRVLSSFEIEAAVSRHPGVLECAAVAVPGPVGPEVRLFVVPAPGVEVAPAELVALVAQHVPGAEPRWIDVVASLPKTEVTDKVRKVELRSLPLLPGTADATIR